MRESGDGSRSAEAGGGTTRGCCGTWAQEEEEAKEMMRLEHLRALELEAIKKEEVKAMNEQFKKDNAKQLEIIAELKLRDLAEDEKYRQLAIEELDKRERARNKMLQVGDAVRAVVRAVSA
jgi:hypothetical protein